MKIFIFCFVLLLALTSGSVYQKYYDEAYKIAIAMNLKQKIGQTIQADFYSITTRKNVTQEAQAAKYFLGSLLVGGDGVANAQGNIVNIPDSDEKKSQQIYANGSLSNWQKLAAKFNYTIPVTTNEGKSYNIKALLATDAVHNNQHVSGTILFPHNIGLSCSHNPDNFKNVGKWTAKNVKNSGFNYAFAPTVAVSHNPQWGRFYETMGQDQDMIYQYAAAFTEGLQGKQGSLTGVLGSVKHFFGDGATMYGADEGNAHVGNFKTFINHNVQGHNGSVSAGVGSVMCSYSSVNWLPISTSPMLQTILRESLDFDGFVISDYDELTKIQSQDLPTGFQKMQDINESVATVLNAGIDMVMIPGFQGIKGVLEYIEAVQYNLQVKFLSQERLNDAVARILSVKMALGLVTTKNQDQSNIRKNEQEKVQEVSASTEYQDSLQAVHESLVLLKNANVIPIKSSTIEYVVLAGERIININGLSKYELFRDYDNIGLQNGGWSSRWQGFEGNSQYQGENKKNTNASSILDALKNLNEKFELVYPNYTTTQFIDTEKIVVERQEFLDHLKTLKKKMNSRNTIILSIVGQSPYAEFSGDVGIPYCMKQTILSGDGCLFDNSQNPYLGDKQRATLELNFSNFDNEIIKSIRQEDKNIPLVTVVFAGRPMLINNILTESSAVLDAFLPGTSGGQGVIDALTGNYVLRPNGKSDSVNSLSFDWPQTTDQLKNFPVYRASGEVPQIQDPLFKKGYGLSSFVGDIYVEE